MNEQRGYIKYSNFFMNFKINSQLLNFWFWATLSWTISHFIHLLKRYECNFTIKMKFLNSIQSVEFIFLCVIISVEYLTLMYSFLETITHMISNEIIEIIMSYNLWNVLVFHSISVRFIVIISAFVTINKLKEKNKGIWTKKKSMEIF